MSIWSWEGEIKHNAVKTNLLIWYISICNAKLIIKWQWPIVGHASVYSPTHMHIGQHKLVPMHNLQKKTRN